MRRWGINPPFMMKTIRLTHIASGLFYCPGCKVVYYNKRECGCDE